MKIFINNMLIKNDLDNNLKIVKAILENNTLRVIYENGSQEIFNGVKKDLIKVEGGEIIDNTTNTGIEERVSQLENMITQLLLLGGEN